MAVSHQGRLGRHADLLPRHSPQRVAVSEFRIFTLDIRCEVSVCHGGGIHPAISESGDSLFSDMQKEVMND
jgi:hypothetical protein